MPSIRLAVPRLQAGTKLQIAVYGGSALMLASNFRFATEDVDVSELAYPLPGWLAAVVDGLARENGWQDNWFNDGSLFTSVRWRIARAIILNSARFRAMPPAGACRFGSIGRLFARVEAEGRTGHRPGSRRNGAARYFELDESRGHLDHGRRHSLARPLLPDERRFFREAAVSIEEHEL